MPVEGNPSVGAHSTWAKLMFKYVEIGFASFLLCELFLVRATASSGVYPGRSIRAVPRELFAVERPHLQPLPAWIPEVYRLHPRTVDVEGSVSVNSARYSVPVAGIGRRVEVREIRDKFEIELDARHIVTHVRVLTPPTQRTTLADHRPPRGQGVKRSDPHPEKQTLVEAAPEIAPYVAALKQKGGKVVALALRQLLRLLKQYPRPSFLAAVREAAQYGLYDLGRLERMILRRVAQDYFRLLDTDLGPHD
jgi:hypothetical protein